MTGARVLKPIVRTWLTHYPWWLIQLLRETQGHSLYVTICQLGCNLQGITHVDISAYLGSIVPCEVQEYSSELALTAVDIVSLLFWPSFFSIPWLADREPYEFWQPLHLWIDSKDPSVCKATGMLLLQWSRAVVCKCFSQSATSGTVPRARKQIQI